MAGSHLKKRVMSRNLGSEKMESQASPNSIGKGIVVRYPFGFALKAIKTGDPKKGTQHFPLFWGETAWNFELRSRVQEPQQEVSSSGPIVQEQVGGSQTLTRNMHTIMAKKQHRLARSSAKWHVFNPLFSLAAPKSET